MDAPSGLLTVRPGEPAPVALRPSAIVTAYNPASRETSEAENQQAGEALRSRIHALSLSAWTAMAHGTGPHAEAWDEPGWCIPGEARMDAVRLGLSFGQNAIVRIDEAGAVSLVCTREGFCGARVGDVVG